MNKEVHSNLLLEQYSRNDSRNDSFNGRKIKTMNNLIASTKEISAMFDMRMMILQSFREDYMYKVSILCIK